MREDEREKDFRLRWEQVFHGRKYKKMKQANISSFFHVFNIQKILLTYLSSL
jgi:hypothetical protein